jgi:hypothetical protein
VRARGPALVLFAAGLVVSGITARSGIQPNDEGLMLQAAARIAGGQMPYGDFWWFYPPGQPYLLGGLERLLGPSLLTWRVVRVLADATVAVLAFELARRRAPLRLAGLAWVVAIGAMAYPSGPHPFPVALALALGALLLFESRPAVAGVLAGACAAWRIEFALALGAGVVAGQLLSGPGRGRAAGAFAAAAAATAAVLYGPVVIAAGWRPSFDLLVDYPLTDFRDYQSLPFPLAYDGPLNTESPGGFLRDSAEPLLLHFLPLALVLGWAGAVLALGRRVREPLVAATGVLSLGMLAYLLTRADLFHTAPLAVVGAVLAAWALAEGAGRGLRAAGAVLAAAALLYAAVEGADRRWLVLRDDTVALDLPVADGVRVPPRQAPVLEAAVAEIDRRVAPGAPIYVATRRADLVTAGNPLLYVLARRPNPTPYDIAAPGVITSARVQREVVADLERTATPLVIRDTGPRTAAREPNAAGRSSGVRILDAYLARRYAPVARFGSLRLLARRP